VWQQVHVVMLAQVVFADSRSGCHGYLHGYPVRVLWQWSCYHGGLKWCFAVHKHLVI